MFNLDIIGTFTVFTAVFADVVSTLLHDADKKLKNDMIANFSIGLCIIIVGLFEKAIAFAFFSLVYHFALFKPHLSYWLWIAAFFCCDFIYYLYHLLEHKTRLFWAAHVTHHSSRYFNLSVALRINFVFLFYRFLFWSPLCFFGFPPEMILFFESITAIQSVFIHTEKIGRLGVFDWIFSTPSNHRVHHASNPEYIDKNLGGILMLFDHLFGTYAKETTTPVYGITHNIDTNKQIKILFQEYIDMAGELSKLKSLLAKLRYLFSSPQ